MPHARSRTGLLPVLVAVAIVAAACSVVAEVGARNWGLSAQNQLGKAQTISVTDTSGLVTDVAFDPEGADLFAGVTAPVGLDNTLDVAWTEGACDERTEIQVQRAGAGLAIAVRVTAGGEGCDAFGTPRAVRLTLAQPIAPGVVTLTQQGA